MTDTQNPEIQYFNLEKRKAYRVYSLSRDQKWWFGVTLGLALALAVLFVWPETRGFSVFSLGMIVLAFGGLKTSDGLVFRNYQAKWDSRRMHATRQGENGQVYDAEKTKRPPIGLKIVTFRLDYGLAELPDYVREHLGEDAIKQLNVQAMDDDATLGTIYSKSEKTDTAFIVGSGHKGANLGPIEGFLARADVVEAIRKTVDQSYDFPSISVIFSTRPWNHQLNSLWNFRNLDPDVVDAEPIQLRNLGLDEDGDPIFDVETFMKASTEEGQALAINQSLAGAVVDGQEGSMAIAITTPRPKGWKQGRNGEITGRLTNKQLRNAPIKKLALALQQEFSRIGVADAGALTSENLVKFVRSKWDVKGIRDWQMLLAERAVALADYEDGHMPFEEVPPMPTAWPEGKIVSGFTNSGRPFLFTDGTYHRVLQVRSFGKPHVFAGGMDELMNTRNFGPSERTGFTLSVCGDIVDVRVERSMHTKALVIRNGYNQTKKDGLHQTPDDIAKLDDMRAREFALYRSGPYAFSFNVYATLSADTPDLLDSVEEAVMANAKGVEVEFRDIPYASRQLRAFMTANLGVNMATR